MRGTGRYVPDPVVVHQEPRKESKSGAGAAILLLQAVAAR